MILQTKFGMAFQKLLLNSGLIFIAAIASFIGGSSGNNSTLNNYHLSDYIIPEHYNIKLIPLVGPYYYSKLNLFEPDIKLVQRKDKFIFSSGESNIIIEILRPTRDISFHVLHSQMDIESIELTNSGGKIYKYMGLHYNLKTQIITVHFNELLIGRYTLNIKFISINTIDNINGLFLTSYKEQMGNTSWIFATRFQGIGARQMFPCWDEPKFKATFNISIKHHLKYMVLSNMPIRTINADKHEIHWTHFKTTFPIPTYLVAIAMTEFSRVDTYQKISILSRPHLKPYIQFANIIAENVTSLLESEWKHMQKIPKVDHVAIPHFWGDGMSNTGLIFYREDSIICNEQMESIARKMEVARLMAYKMTYQLFGSVVSPSSWSDLWLNEGLSVLFGMDTLNKIFMHPQMMDLFVVQNQHESLQLNSYFAMNQEVNNPSEINSLFYLPRHIKAFCILRMLKHLITDDLFRKGIHIYLNRHAFNLVTPDDLWKAMQIALEKYTVITIKPNIKKIMNSWIQQKHYPVLRVTRNYKTGLVNVSIPSFNESDERNWWIPLSFTTQLISNFSTSLDETRWIRYTPRHFSVQFPSHSKMNDWIILNLQQSGYYRVNYDNNNWQRIATYLKTSNYMNIHVLNRAKIIDDAFHFLVVGELNSSVFWNLTSYLSQETDFIAWYPMIKAFEYMSTIFPFSDKRVEEIKEKMHQMLDGLLKNIGYEENTKEDYFIKCLMQEAAKWACKIRHSQCMLMARIKFLHYIQHPEIDKPLPWWQEWTYCNGLIALNVNLIKFTDMQIDNKFIGCSDDATVVIKRLKLIEKARVNKEDSEHTIIKYFHSIIAKQVKNDKVLEYMLSHFDEIKPRKNSTVAALIDIINHVYSKEQLYKINKFVENNMKHLYLDVKHKIDIRLSQINDQMNYIHIFGNHK